MSTAGILTQEQAVELIGHLADQDAEAALDLLDRHNATPPFVLDLLCAFAGRVIRLLPGFDADDSEGMVIMQVVGANRDVSPPQFLQAMIAAANNDRDMLTAHLDVMAQAEPHVLARHIVDAMTFTMHLLDHFKEAHGD